MDKAMESKKEGVIEDVLVALNCFIKVTSEYADNCSDNEPLDYIYVMLTKMQEEIDKLKPYYDVIS